jgi:hypothetical protein
MIVATIDDDGKRALVDVVCVRCRRPLCRWSQPIEVASGLTKWEQLEAALKVQVWWRTHGGCQDGTQTGGGR